jgi:hypothetical protein
VIAVHANHYPLKREVRGYRSFYEHRDAAGYASYLRSGGWDAIAVPGGAVVFYGPGEEPNGRRAPSSRACLPSDPSCLEGVRAVNAYAHGLALNVNRPALAAVYGRASREEALP